MFRCTKGRGRKVRRAVGGKGTMSKNTNYKTSERGTAMIFALLAILLLSILAVAIMSTSQAQTWTASNYRLTAQARYAAEAGIQSTMNWLSSANYVPPTNFAPYDMTKNPVQFNGQPVILSAANGISANYPDAAVSTAFTNVATATLPVVANASYASYATLLRMSPSGGASFLGAAGGVVQTWQITSIGTVAGIRNASVQVVQTFERTGTPIFNYAVETTGTGCGAMTFQGKDGTDSYNSNLGAYGGTNVQNSGGNIASNGNVSLGNGTAIGGIIAVPNNAVGACPNGITNSGGKFGGSTTLNPALNPPLPWGCTAQPCYPYPLPPTTAMDVSTSCATMAGCTKNGTVSLVDGGKSTTANVFTLAPGLYGNLIIDAADVVHLSAGTYTVNSLNFATDGQIVVDSGPVIFNVAGQGIGGSSGVSSNGVGGGSAGGGGKGGSYGTNSSSGGGGGGNGSSSSGYAIFAAGYAGFNACANGVTANPDVYGKATCGPSAAPISGIPSNFQIVYGGTATIRVGGLPDCGVIYAPASPFLMPGAPVGFYGAILSNTFTDTSSSPFHYDAALGGSITQVGQYRPVGGFSWSKF
jgi:Tfp pilus assembly protein PilX